MERILELAMKKAQAAEVFRIERSLLPVCFRDARLATSEREDMWAAALRLVAGGRVGFSTTTSPDDAQGLVERALAAATVGPEDVLPFQSARLEAGEGPAYDPRVADLSVQEMIRRGTEMIGTIRGAFPDIDVNGDIARSIDQVRVINSAGGDVSFRKTMYQAYIEVLMTLEGDRAELEHGWSSTNLTDGHLEIARQAIWRFSNCGRVAPVATGRMPVIFTSLAFRGLFVPLFAALNGHSVFRKTSILTGRLGEQVVDPRITLADDPTAPGLPGSVPADDEGVPAYRKLLIDQGRLAGFYYDLRSAAKAGAASTGNGFKKASLYTGFSVDALPGPTPSNFVISPGDTERDRIIAGIKEGIIVDDTIGAGQGNNMAGEFSMNVALGYKIENGQIVGRLKDVMVAGNVIEALSHLRALSREVHPEDTLFGRYQVPWVAIDDLSVSAT